jgi:hypothetical protein
LCGSEHYPSLAKLQSVFAKAGIQCIECEITLIHLILLRFSDNARTSVGAVPNAFSFTPIRCDIQPSSRLATSNLTMHDPAQITIDAYRWQDQAQCSGANGSYFCSDPSI